MESISKEKCLIARDEEGNLLPVEVILESLPDKPYAKIIPLTKGNFNKLINDPDSEDDILRTHIIEPSFTEEEFVNIKPAMYGAFKMAILSVTTDVSQSEIQDSTTKALLDSIEQKKKNTEMNKD